MGFKVMGPGGLDKPNSNGATLVLYSVDNCPDRSTRPCTSSISHDGRKLTFLALRGLYDFISRICRCFVDGTFW